MSKVQIHKKLLIFLYQKMDKKIINEYLSVFNIKLLQTDTLFPICINQSSKEFKNFIKRYKNLGNKIFVKLKKMEQPIFNRFTLVNINKYTLVPVATLIFISHLNFKHNGQLLNYMSEQFGNDSIELISKKRGIKRLTPLTLVPISFIYGKIQLYNYYHTDENFLLKKKHVILKDPLLQKYLKKIGINNNSIPSFTMVPLGDLLALHYIYGY